jgi:hypothetical protein
MALMAGLRTSWLVAGLIIAAHSAALAEDAPPQVDSDKYCEAASAFADDSGAQKLSRDTCLKKEAVSGEKLARVWSQVPASDRHTCLKYLALTLPSNQGLAVCIGRVMGEHFLNGDLPGRQ